jgi:hypothetical protein
MLLFRGNLAAIDLLAAYLRLDGFDRLINALDDRGLAEGSGHRLFSLRALRA